MAGNRSIAGTIMNDLSSPSRQDFLHRVRAIAPLIENAAKEIEGTRRLTPPVVEALIEGGFYRMLQPRSLGHRFGKPHREAVAPPRHTHANTPSSLAL